MSTFESCVAIWLIEIAIASTALLAPACLLLKLLKQPEHRLAVARATLWALLAFFAASAVRSAASFDAVKSRLACPNSPQCACADHGLPTVSQRRAALNLATGIVAVSSAWLVLGWRLSRRLTLQSKPAPEHIQAIARQISGTRANTPKVVVCPRLASPLAIGAFRPIIALPADFVASEDDEGIRLAIAHESAHLKNGDLRALAAIRALDVVLLAHPLFWALKHSLKRDQEILADSIAIAYADPFTYAERLLAWARSSPQNKHHWQWAGAIALSAPGGLLRHRVLQILSRSSAIHAPCSNRWRWMARITAIGFASTIFCTLAPIAPTIAANSNDQAEKVSAGDSIAAQPIEACWIAPPPASFTCPPGQKTN
jgi:beta-lactamase regulating signal transducer with metallopeptidase domain